MSPGVEEESATTREKKMHLFTGKQNLEESPYAGSFAST